MTVTIKYGLETISRTVPEGTTIGHLVSDQNLKAVLGFGDNVRALINGIEMSRDVQVPYGSLVSLETACNSKA